ncbi:hypothetical protein VIGAN_04035600 [Vigna angularis var. angularis]|uniref:Uncharacterized protein n=1 Tax=Vigna angularis var. angularis TaxID=157739 RepID=A0A0S3RRJ8_PHAAN|nr:hypothetical protein VIGAN_04035600 [Vigna angularis var. angularis]
MNRVSNSFQITHLRKTIHIFLLPLPLERSSSPATSTTTERNPSHLAVSHLVVNHLVVSHLESRLHQNRAGAIFHAHLHEAPTVRPRDSKHRESSHSTGNTPDPATVTRFSPNGTFLPQRRVDRLRLGHHRAFLPQRRVGCLRLGHARFFPNGEWVASADAFGTVRIWGTRNDFVLKEFRVLSAKRPLVVP